MRLGYNTNGFPQHRLEDVCDLLAELGYDGIAITPDVFHLDPFGEGPARAPAIKQRLGDLGLAVAVETGARFVLDARRKHQPTLLSDAAGAEQRLDLLKRCFDLAVTLGAETFSFWSGTAETAASREVLVERLVAGTGALLDHTAGSGVSVCVEPEPGMLVASLAELDEFCERLGRPELAVMLDVGHVPVTESIAADEAIRRLAPRLGGLQLDDSRDGVHEHLFPGDGEIDFPAVAAAVEAVGFAGLASLELPRHGHDPVRTARAAIDVLRAL